MIAKVLGKKSLLSYLGTIIAGALAFGLLIDYVLPVEWFTQITQNHLGHLHENHLNWWQLSSGIILLMLIINGYIQKYRISKKNINQKINSSMEIKTIKVEGMTCNHCKSNVENNLVKLPFVKSAVVNLADKSVTLEGDNIEIETAKETINSLGYSCQ